MTATTCHAEASTGLAAAKLVIQKELGVANVARWCEVTEATVYQWLSRGSDAEPIPPRYVPRIVDGARAEGFAFEWLRLWPAATGLRADPVLLPDDIQ
jgi:hypothetical protein